LVALLRARDEATYVHLVESWAPTMTRIARTYVSTAETAAEVVQDTWVAVLTGIDRFEGRSSLRTWVFRILTNRATTRGAREDRTVPWSSLDVQDSSPSVEPSRFRGSDDEYPGHWRSFPQQWPDPEQAAIQAEVHAAVAGAVEQLPHRQQVVLLMRDLLGFSSDEVCDVLGVSAANQRVLLHRARATVRSQLEQLFGSAAHEVAAT
jgi:RNA polymerase sigma-70 factor (ECF subfamily)